MAKTESKNNHTLWSFSEGIVHHELESDGRYRIDNYDQIGGFCSFLPGIAGENGVPLWCMYVNRAQAVVSFGVNSKDQAIAEFLPATWAYQLVGVQGFRTFCKIDGQYYEPFQHYPQTIKDQLKRSMWVSPERLQLREENLSKGLRFDIEYFSPVDQFLGTLFRNVQITNISDKTLTIEGMDGLALILPSGFNDGMIKSMRRLSEAYASVKMVDDKFPFYSTKVISHDEAEVISVTHGNFYASFFHEGNKMSAIEPYVDPDVIFGINRDLVTPHKFIDEDDIDRTAQVYENRLPCALSPFKCKIKPNESIKLTGIAGFAENENMLKRFMGKITAREDIDEMSSNLSRTVNKLLQPATAVSNMPTLDAYSRQNFMDNLLRGGKPVLLPSRSGDALLHLYSRRHGDLERDYNHFELMPTPLSSGPGNYRDVCQNRRHDVWFYPEVFDREIRMFLSLIQADGYNPLSVEGYNWNLDSGIDALSICPAGEQKAAAAFCEIVSRNFHPGQLLHWADIYEVKIPDRQSWLKSILKRCKPHLIASGYEGGYWIDHWTYIIDMLESFNAVFPDKTRDMLTKKADITWFNEGAYIVPRNDKYILKSSGPLQLNSVIDVAISDRKMIPVTPLGKLCALIAIKALSFDYMGAGIEMEAGRPGWNDSLNGLPGLFGSSTCETAELERLASWLLDNVPVIPETVFPLEIADLIDKTVDDLNEPVYSWDRAANIREYFRQRFQVPTGKSKIISSNTLEQLLVGTISRCDEAIQKSFCKKTGLIHTYYVNKPVLEKITLDIDPIQLNGGINIGQVKEFESKPMPLYLEGQVHLMRVAPDREKIRDIYQAVHSSELFDTQLKMYKLNECLNDWPVDIGRARTFTRGWYENESIWPHMLYKYLLELLKAGLYEEFFADAQTMLTPFMNPKVYGRSILENSSFIAPSICPDPNARGRGFVARLSGSTAEFIHMWQLLTVGPAPFICEEGKLKFSLRPVLHGKWFTTKDKKIKWNDRTENIPAGCFACTLLSDILLVYHNESQKNTFGDNGVQPVKYVLDNAETVKGSCINDSHAESIRQKAFNRIDIWLE